MFRAWQGQWRGARRTPPPQQTRRLTRRDQRKRAERMKRVASVCLALGGAYGAWACVDAVLAYREPVQAERARVVVLGAGFGALAFAQTLSPKRFDVTLVAPRTHFEYTPALVATLFGQQDALSVLEPVRALRARLRRDFAFIHAHCDDVDFAAKRVRCSPVSAPDADSQPLELPYDYLVIATGAETDTCAVPGVPEHAHLVDSYAHLRALRAHVLDALERAAAPALQPPPDAADAAEDDTLAAERRALTHFVVVGGSPVAREVAKELSEFLRDTLRPEHGYPAPLREEARVTLIASADHVHNYYDHAVSKYYRARHRHDAVHERRRCAVTRVTERGVTLRCAHHADADDDDLDDKAEEAGAAEEELAARTVIWATGRSPTRLTRTLQARLGAEQPHTRALLTDHALRVRGAQDVYALGECATVDQHALMAKWEALFKESDVNHDGVIDRDEFRALCVAMGRRYPALLEVATRAEELFAHGDANADGKLSMPEFETLMKHLDETLTRFPATASTAVQQGHFLAAQFNAGAHAEGAEEEAGVFRYKHIGGFEYVGAEGGLVERGSQGASIVSGAGAWWLWNNVYFSSLIGLRMRVRLALNAALSALFGAHPVRE